MAIIASWARRDSESKLTVFLDLSALLTSLAELGTRRRDARDPLYEFLTAFLRVRSLWADVFPISELSDHPRPFLWFFLQAAASSPGEGERESQR